VAEAVVAADSALKALEAKEASFEAGVKAGEEDRKLNPEKAGPRGRRLKGEDKERETLVTERGLLEGARDAANATAVKAGLKVKEILSEAAPAEDPAAANAANAAGAAGAGGGAAGGGAAGGGGGGGPSGSGGRSGKEIRGDMAAIAAEWEVLTSDEKALVDKFADALKARAVENKVEKQAVIDGWAKSEAKQLAAVGDRRGSLEARRATVAAEAAAAGVDVSDVAPPSPEEAAAAATASAGATAAATAAEGAASASASSGAGGGAGGGPGAGSKGASPKELRAAVAAVVADRADLDDRTTALEDRIDAGERARAQEGKKENPAVVAGRAKSEGKQRATLAAELEALEARWGVAMAAAAEARVEVGDLLPAEAPKDVVVSAADAAAAATVDRVNDGAASSAAAAAAKKQAVAAARVELDAVGALLGEWEGRKDALEAKFEQVKVTESVW